MGKHFRRVVTTLAPLAVVVGYLLTHDVPTVLDQADKSAAEIARAIGFSEPWQHMARYVWEHPYLALVGVLLLLALGAGTSWVLEWAYTRWKRRNEGTIDDWLRSLQPPPQRTPVRTAEPDFWDDRLSDEDNRVRQEVLSRSARSANEAQELLTQTLLGPAGIPLPKATKPPPIRRDMPFRDALRHFAYKSRWAHAFEHPEGDWMTVVRWPQAVHREFCQPLIDDDLIAWGIRREPGKPAENGLTKISGDFWRTAQFEAEHTLEDPERTGWAKDAQGVIFSGIVFNRAQVEGHWPAVEADTASPIETAAKAWWALRSADVAESRAHMAEQVERAQEARQAAAQKMADPYREAVLRLEKAEVTRMSDGEHLTKVECHLRLTSRVMLLKCCVWISELRGPETVPIEAFCRTGRSRDKTFKTDFAVPAGHIQPVALIKRDLADIVSNPPFLLLTDKGEYPLADNSEYLLRLELRSEAKYPTLVDLKVVTGVKEALDVSISTQTV